MLIRRALASISISFFLRLLLAEGRETSLVQKVGIVGILDGTVQSELFLLGLGKLRGVLLGIAGVSSGVGLRGRHRNIRVLTQSELAVAQTSLQS